MIDAVDANTAPISQGYPGLSLLGLQQLAPPECCGGEPPGCWCALPACPRHALAEVRPAHIYNPGLVTAWHYVTGVMSIMFINASLVASALLVKDKQTGMIEQLLLTPV